MKLVYEEPQFEVRKYSLPPKNVVMTSYIDDNNNTLEDYEDYDILN